MPDHERIARLLREMGVMLGELANEVAPTGAVGGLTEAIRQIQDAYIETGPESSRLEQTIQEAVKLTGLDCALNNENPIGLDPPEPSESVDPNAILTPRAYVRLTGRVGADNGWYGIVVGGTGDRDPDGTDVVVPDARLTLGVPSDPKLRGCTLSLPASRYYRRSRYYHRPDPPSPEALAEAFGPGFVGGPGIVGGQS